MALARSRLVPAKLRSDPLFRRLLSNSSWLFGGSGLALALGLASSVLKARALGPELFGLLAVVTAFAGAVAILATLQPWQAVIKYGALGLDGGQPGRFVAAVKLGLLLDLIGAGIGTLVCLLAAYLLMPRLGWSTNTVKLGAVCAILVVTNSLSTPIAVLRLLDRFHVLAVQQVLTSGLALGGAVAVYAIRGGVWAFLMVQIGAQCVGTVFLAWSAWRALRQRHFSSIWKSPINEWRPMVRFSAWTFLQSSTSVPYRHLDILIAGSVVSVEGAGIYRIIKQVQQVFMVPAGPMYQAIYPQFASLVANKDEGAAMRYATRVGVVTLAVLAPVALVLAVTSHWWLPALFGSAYSQASIPLAVFLWFSLLGAATMPVHPLFLALGFAGMSTAIGLVTGAVYLGLAILLGRQFGLVGIGLAYGTEICVGAILKVAYIRSRRRHWSERLRGAAE